MPVSLIVPAAASFLGLSAVTVISRSSWASDPVRPTCFAAANITWSVRA